MSGWDICTRPTPGRVAEARSGLLSAESAARLASLLAMMTPRPAVSGNDRSDLANIRTGLTRVRTARAGRWPGRLR